MNDHVFLFPDGSRDQCSSLSDRTEREAVSGGNKVQNYLDFQPFIEELYFIEGG